MEDLYGRTQGNPVPAQEPKFYRTNFGRITPSDLNRSRQGRISPTETNKPRPGFSGRMSPDLNRSRIFSGSLAPQEGSLAPGTRQQAGPQQPGLLNISSHNSSKISSTNSGATSSQTKTTMDSSHHDLNSTQISPISATRKALLDRLNGSQVTNHSQLNGGTQRKEKKPLSNLLLVSADTGAREMLQSLGLLCIVSLLLALLSLVFLLKISPMPEQTETRLLTLGEYITVYEVTLSMCILTLCLNLSCLLVCSIQFLFTAKLVKSNQGRTRSNKYLKKAAVTRVCAIAGFFISIPLFLIGIVLFTFIHFNSTPAIVTSIVIGIGIVFCGGAVVHNVFIWQRERTVTRKDTTILSTKGRGETGGLTQLSHITLPHATLDLSNGLNGTLSSRGLELSTLV